MSVFIYKGEAMSGVKMAPSTGVNDNSQNRVTTADITNQIYQEVQGKTSGREISKADFDALTEAEKNNGTEYFIKDMQLNTDNYNLLSNKPSINGISLKNNITLEQLGLTSTEVVDDLESEDTDKALSANQGKVLDDKITELSESMVEVVDDLESEDTDKALSANQGKVLDGKITEVNTAVGNCMLKSAIHISTSNPTSSDGADGDIWIVYEA